MKTLPKILATGAITTLALVGGVDKVKDVQAEKEKAVQQEARITEKLKKGEKLDSQDFGTAVRLLEKQLKAKGHNTPVRQGKPDFKTLL